MKTLLTFLMIKIKYQNFVNKVLQLFINQPYCVLYFRNWKYRHFEFNNISATFVLGI